MCKKQVIKLKVQNGLSFKDFVKDVFEVNKVSELFDFEEVENPDFIIFGPYGNDIPKKGEYTRVGYYCENIIPDLSICEWAFGVPREENVANKNYFRIQWHGFDPNKLVKVEVVPCEEILRSKTKFCNFIYSHQVPYREYFFSRLSKYKKIDSPGKSMNNMKSIDSIWPGDRWMAKRKFQCNYKFTLALENYVYPGYQTEKLYDGMLSDTVPIYIGDPHVGDIFNTKSFISLSDNDETSFFLNKIKDFAQLDFKDFLPTYYSTPPYRIKRKVKGLLKDFRMKWMIEKYYEGLIYRIVESDKDDEKYIKMVSEPWLKNNCVDVKTYSKEAWIKIFNDSQRTV